MKHIYRIYKATDFLADDYFIDTMLNPTPESEKFWSTLIQEDRIDHAEFISAYTMIRRIHGNKPGVPDGRIESVWHRINATIESRRTPQKSRRRMVWPVSVAAALVAGLVLAAVLRNPPGEGEPHAGASLYETILENRTMPEKIELVSGDTTMELDGQEVNVEVGAGGELLVNDAAVDVAPAAGPVMSSLRVPYARRANLKLPDGTMLWLNSGSTVVYPSSFEGVNREIFIEGEVYAQVAHDAAKPFIVRTKNLSVTVLGTAFNITAYRDEPYSDVVLVDGSLSVSVPAGGETVLEPGHRFLLDEGRASVSRVNVDKYVSWRDGVYIFTNEPIENILSRLSRYYNVRMNMPGSASGITCSGKLVLQDELGQLLQGLSEITTMRYVLADSECFIRFDN